ncbi:MAG: Nif3-like dinuclear metal center hexameric protein [Verrucomicrobiota bacterium]
MASLDDLTGFLNRELKTAEIPDYPGAVNGLQLANRGQVSRIVAAVDASLAVVRKAAEGGPGLLIVHHGMFWQGVQTVTGPFYEKLSIAMEAGLAIYSSHLPLDVHPEWGNNVCLAREIGLVDPSPFMDWKGIHLGMRGTWNGSRDALKEKLESILEGRVHVCPGGKENISKVALITGGAGSEVAKVALTDVDAFITGEGPHWSYPLAEELGLNVFYGGHYATETFGVKALSASLSQKFGIPWQFVDQPSGL